MEGSVWSNSDAAGRRCALGDVCGSSIELLRIHKVCQSATVLITSIGHGLAAIAAAKQRSYLAKVHRLDTLTSQCRTNGRAGTRLACSNNQFDHLVDGACYAFFRHVDAVVAVARW